MNLGNKCNNKVHWAGCKKPAHSIITTEETLLGLKQPLIFNSLYSIILHEQPCACIPFLQLMSIRRAKLCLHIL